MLSAEHCKKVFAFTSHVEFKKQNATLLMNHAIQFVKPHLIPESSESKASQ